MEADRVTIEPPPKLSLLARLKPEGCVLLLLFGILFSVVVDLRQ